MMSSDGLPARLKDYIGLVAFVVFLSTLCGVAWFNPYYNWDSLPYTALTQVSSSDPLTLHAAAYDTIDAEAPLKVSQEFHSPERYPNYRGDMASNPWHFAEQLPLYSVKTLYILILSGIHHTGPSALKAMRLVSVVSFAVLGAILFFWLRRYAGSLLAAVGAGFVLSTAEFLGTGAETTPDALFGALALLGFYFIFADEKLFPGLCLLGALPMVRSDGLVLLVLVLAYLAWKTPGLPKSYALTILVVEFLVSGMTARLAGGYSFQKLFYHSFVERQLAPAETIVHVTFREYFHALYIFVLGTLATPRPIYFLLGLTSLKPGAGTSALRHLAWLGLAFTAIHILLFPLPDSRFLLLPFALFVVWTICALFRPEDGASTS
jgi:hypothetical protein